MEQLDEQIIAVLREDPPHSLRQHLHLMARVFDEVAMKALNKFVLWNWCAALSEWHRALRQRLRRVS